MVKYTRRGERERERKKSDAERFALDIKDIVVFDICNKNTHHFLIKALLRFARTERERESEERFASPLLARVFFSLFLFLFGCLENGQLNALFSSLGFRV